MVLVTCEPKTAGAGRRERRLWVVLSEWMTRRRCAWVNLQRPMDGLAGVCGEVLVGLVVVKGPEDLKEAAAFRDFFPHGRLVAVVLSTDSEILTALQTYSPCFIALNERDDAAVPDVLERLGNCV